MDYNEIVTLQVRRIFSVVAKRMLILLEDLQNDHNINFDKLRRNLSEELQTVIEQADYFDDAKFNHLRKRVLDLVGDAGRELTEELAKFEIDLRR